jgi:intraflagellar transport protein 52
MIFIGDGGEAATGCSLNKELLEELGITVNNDCVTRSAYYKYYHPKEVFIAEGILIPDLAKRKVCI